MKICKKLSKNPKVLSEMCRLNIMCSLNKKGERMIKNKKQFLNESNKVNCHPGGFSDGNFQITKECHPEERSELRFLPVIDDSQERWSDSEHTRLVNESHVGCFRMTKNTEGRGEAKEFTLNSLPLPLGANFRTGETRGARTLSRLVQSTKGETVRA